MTAVSRSKRIAQKASRDPELIHLNIFIILSSPSNSKNKNQLTKHAKKSKEVDTMIAAFSPKIFHPKPAKIPPIRGAKSTNSSILVSLSSYLRLRQQLFHGFGKSSRLWLTQSLPPQQPP